jgi:hypothetical protein
MTICDRRIRQKQSLGSELPIQYFPLWSFHPSSTAEMLMFTGILLTTSPTATSIFDFGFATYLRFGCDPRREELSEARGVPEFEVTETRGARPHVERGKDGVWEWEVNERVDEFRTD